MSSRDRSERPSTLLRKSPSGSNTSMSKAAPSNAKSKSANVRKKRKTNNGAAQRLDAEAEEDSTDDDEEGGMNSSYKRGTESKEESNHFKGPALDYSFMMPKPGGYGHRRKTIRIEQLVADDKDNLLTILPGRDACDRCYRQYQCVIKTKSRGLSCLSCASAHCSFTTDTNPLRGRQYLTDLHTKMKETYETWSQRPNNDQAPPEWAIELLSKGHKLVAGFLRANKDQFKSYSEDIVKPTILGGQSASGSQKAPTKKRTNRDRKDGASGGAKSAGGDPYTTAETGSDEEDHRGDEDDEDDQSEQVESSDDSDLDGIETPDESSKDDNHEDIDKDGDYVDADRRNGVASRGRPKTSGKGEGNTMGPRPKRKR